MKYWVNIFFVSLYALSFFARADANANQQTQQNNVEQIIVKAMAVAKLGPAEIALRDQAVLKLPAGYAYIPEQPAGEWMRAVGNSIDENFLGLILPQDDKSQWLVSIDFMKSGYIKDDDAKDWNVDDLFNSLKEGTAEQNKERQRLGIPALELIGWVQKPTYDAQAHRLLWSVSARNTSQPTNESPTINYNTYALGRDGYITLNLITSLNAIEQDKTHANTLLTALQFKEGKRYSDFNPSTDHVAEYGLAALVAGAAAKKLGFLALAGAFLLKAWKLILIGVFAVGAGFKKFFGKNDQA